MITTTYRIQRYQSRDDYSGHQDLLRETRVLGICVWTTKIDSEPVPSWASIQQACLGFTDWESRLHKQLKLKINQ